MFWPYSFDKEFLISVDEAFHLKLFKVLEKSFELGKNLTHYERLTSLKINRKTSRKLTCMFATSMEVSAYKTSKR